MTSFSTQQGKDYGYCLQFETDDKEKFLYMQAQARQCVANKHNEDDVKPVRHGHWKERYFPLPLSDGSRHGFQCSECKTHWDCRSNYCPNCGAKMDEVK